MVDSVSQPQRSGGTVSVGCKLPHGIVLHIDDMVESYVDVIGQDAKKLTHVAQARPETVTLYGTATPFGVAPKALIVGGYAITPGISQDFWEAWVKQNAKTDLVRNKVVIAHGKPDSVVDMAKERAEIRSGLEPVNRFDLKGDVRVPKRIAPADAKVA